MKPTGGLPWAAFVALAVLFHPPTGAAEEARRGWKVSAEGGPSFFTQNVAPESDLKGSLGPAFHGGIAYDIDPRFSVGLDLDWQEHKVKQSSQTLGHASTLSFFARFEWHISRSPDLSPYLLFGVGYNLNNFDEEDSYLDAWSGACRVDVDDSVSIRVGFGADLFLLSESAAINIEASWAYNQADLEIVEQGATVVSDDFKAHSLTVLFGLRYHFPPVPAF